MDSTFLLDRLLSPRQSGPNTYTAKCPAHEDNSPSLTVTVNEDRILVHCHAGCDSREVLKAIDLEWNDLFEDDGHEKTHDVIAQYEYRDIEGRLQYVVERLYPKSFRQRRPLPEGGWAWNLDGTPKLLYRLPQVNRAIEDGRWIFVVEGEKDVHTLEAAGFAATTASAGVGGWKPELAEYFAGAKVAVIPDNDEPGRRLAENVAASAASYADEVRIVELPDLPAKGDVTDWFAQGGTPEQLKELVRNESVWTPGPVSTLNHVTAKPIDWLWKNRIPRGKLTLVAGTQGGGKSYLSMAMLSSLSRGAPLPGNTEGFSEPTESLYVTYEDDPGDTLRPRAEKLGADLTKIHVWDARLHPFGVPGSLETIKALLHARPNIKTIIIDPLMSALTGVDMYRENEVREGLNHLLGLGLTVIGIMHLTKGDRDSVVYRVAGSSGFTALARSVIMVEDWNVRVVKSNVAPLGQNIGFLIDDDGFRWAGK